MLNEELDNDELLLLNEDDKKLFVSWLGFAATQRGSSPMDASFPSPHWTCRTDSLHMQTGPETRRSVSAFVVMLNGAAVAWKSKKQGAVALYCYL
jgi:hypothetical protein